MAKYKILVVDDDPDIKETFGFRLELLGYEVIGAADGMEGLEMVRKEKPDLVLLDIAMPRKNGWQVCQELRQNEITKNIPVIMVTAESRESDKMRGIKLGANAYMVKPFNAADLVKKIKELLMK